MKRDLLFVVERLAALLDENSLSIVARQHGIKKAKDSDPIGNLLTACLRRAEDIRVVRTEGRALRRLHPKARRRRKPSSF